MTGYFTPFIIGVFFDDVIQLTFFEISLAISWSLKLVGYLNTMVNRYINIYDRIISYARMEYFMHRARLERTDAEKFEPSLDQLDIVAKLRNIQLTLNKKKQLEKIDLKVKKGEIIGIYGR
jgi:ABC-type multidrug transport system fused ATPase/permease subunit